MHTTTSDPSQLEAIRWTDNGPQLGPKIPAMTQLSPEAEATINEAILQIRKEYEEVERKNTTRKTNELGHQIVTVKVFSKDNSRLEDKFWTAADSIVTNDFARGQLREHITRNVLFPYGDTEVTYEIWRIGAWYHFRSGSYTSKGPSLPYDIARLWQPPDGEAIEKSEAPPDAKTE